MITFIQALAKTTEKIKSYVNSHFVSNDNFESSVNDYLLKEKEELNTKMDEIIEGRV